MSKHEYSSLNAKLPWSFLGFFSGLVFGIFGLYAVFVYQKLPDLEIKIISNVPVFSVNEDIADLQILFNNQDIRKTKKQLSILTVRVSNLGNLPITTGDFDDKAPLILKVTGGEVIRSDILNTSDAYLRKVFQGATKLSNGISFPKFILDEGQYFLFKLLVLHDASIQPELSATGRIAHVKSIDVVNSSAETETTLIGEAFSGNIAIQGARIGGYGLGTTVTIIIILIISINVSDKYRDIKNRRHAKIIVEKGIAFLNALDLPMATNLTPFVRFFALDKKRARRLARKFSKIQTDLDDKQNEHGGKEFLDHVNSTLRAAPPWVTRHLELSHEDIKPFVDSFMKLYRYLGDL